MRENVIFDGLINGTSEEVQQMINLFVFENFYFPNVNFDTELSGPKQVWVINPQEGQEYPKDKIINGFAEITTPSLQDPAPVHFRLVSCRPELDLLFFQLAERIQAKFVIPGYPPEVLTKSWQELIASGAIAPLTRTAEDMLVGKLPDPKGKVPRYGRDRKLTGEQVIEIVSRCRYMQDAGGTVEWYYDQLPSTLTDQFALETLKAWLKDPRFRQPRKPIRKPTR